MNRPDWLKNVAEFGVAGLSNKARLLSVLAALSAMTGGIGVATVAYAATGVNFAPKPRSIDLTHGAQGPAGPAGPQGPKGDTGARGPKGDPGEGDGTFTKCPPGYELDDLTINHPSGHITILACVKND